MRDRKRLTNQQTGSFLRRKKAALKLTSTSTFRNRKDTLGRIHTGTALNEPWSIEGNEKSSLQSGADQTNEL